MKKHARQTRQLRYVRVACPKTCIVVNAKHDVYPCPRTAAEQLVNLISELEYNEARNVPDGGNAAQRFMAFKKRAFALLTQVRYEVTRDRLLESLRVPDGL